MSPEVRLAAPVVALFAIVVAGCGSSEPTASIPSSTSSAPPVSAVPITTTPTTTAAPTTTTTTEEPPSATVEPDPLDPVETGACLRNDGTNDDPVMVPAACKAGTYKVLARKTGTINPNACSGVPRYNATYMVEKFTVYTRTGLKVPDIASSYVFCLRRV